jgi:predicted PurR-regulated permease PerM
MPDNEPAPTTVDSSAFVRRMQLTTMSILSLVLVIHLLEKFRDVLQPLFLALFLVFLVHPIHRWLVDRRIPSMLAYVVIVAIVGLCVTGIGSLMYANFAHVTKEMDAYEVRLENKIIAVASNMPLQMAKPLEGGFLRTLITRDQITSLFGTAIDRLGGFTSWTALTLVYLLFLVAEKFGFPDRLAHAFGAEHGKRMMGVVDSIMHAISQYIAVKTAVSALAGVLSYVVLVAFDVEFAATWGLLIFLFNYIPYLGSLVAVAAPILMAFVQFDELWQGIVIGALLIGIQQIIGFVIEPRMAGQRLDVSPVLIVLSLAFWGVVWGIIGMILAVPLLVVTKIIFDNIEETKAIGRLISNR